MPQPDDKAVSWRTSWRTNNDTAVGWQPDGPPAAAPDPAIEVFEADELLGIGRGTDILMVDDDATSLAAYEAALAPLGRRLVGAQSGIAALARLLDQDFALVLLDVSMPDMTGLETARRIRERPRNRGLPIMFITGVAWSTDVVLEAYDAGAFDFIVKPVLPEVLRAKARVYLQLQERTHALRKHSAELREAHALLARADEQLRDREVEAAARRAAEEASRRKDEFVAMLSHELRNPLWAAANALAALRAVRHGLDPELAITERQLGHLTQLVGELLDVGRLTRGKIELRREAVQLAGVVADAIGDARPRIERRAHQVTAEVPGDLLVDADRHRLRQVVENLLDNAVDNTPDRGHIAISAGLDGAFVRVTVRDDGRGISAALLSSLFELFVQGEQPLDRADGRLGVGLTLARTLVELHGGTIEAHSDGPDRGATFTLRWPRASEATPTAKIAPLARPDPVPRRRVLIVDDNADAAEMLAALLQTLGYDTAVAVDGAAALDAARDFAPHIALLDIGLPIMDGYEVARRLRQLETCRHTLLIAVSGYGQPSDRERSLQAGFAHHLVKPVELATLTALLETAHSDPAP
ncbi:MAG TPA: response regulator [Kofleriaceae bacterium]|jgi:CheY-like chemotaxis protein|nr:response regulator [Kofleriaceae bacterium]